MLHHLSVPVYSHRQRSATKACLLSCMTQIFWMSQQPTAVSEAPEPGQPKSCQERRSGCCTAGTMTTTEPSQCRRHFRRLGNGGYEHAQSADQLIGGVMATKDSAVVPRAPRKSYPRAVPEGGWKRRSWSRCRPLCQPARLPLLSPCFSRSLS